MRDASEPDDVEAIRERKAQEIQRRTTTPDEPVHVESATQFDELVADRSPLLVDFYADWCGPCKMLEPAVERVAAETDATVAEVDVDEHQALAGRYDVQGVPTLLLFADGDPVERLVGVQDEGTLTDLVASYA